MQHGFCNNLFCPEKFATVQFATYPKFSKFHATLFCNNNVANTRFCKNLPMLQKSANILNYMKINKQLTGKKKALKWKSLPDYLVFTISTKSCCLVYLISFATIQSFEKVCNMVFLQHLKIAQKGCKYSLCNISKCFEKSCNNFLQQKCCKKCDLATFFKCCKKKANVAKKKLCPAPKSKKSIS